MMEEFEGKLPSTWIATTLGEVCSQPQYGYTTKGSDTGTLRLLRTTDITSGNICWGSVPFCLENPRDESKYLLDDGDIVISRAGSVGVSYLLKNPERSVFASYLIRFKPYIDTQYFKYFLDSPYYWQEIADNKLGIAVPNVNASKLKEIAIPLPPENEQLRIVAKIEELFSELDKGIESLKTAQAQLKVYRQALLKHAFEGKLTTQWRSENQDKLETAEALLARIQQDRAQRYQQQLAEWEASGKQGSKPKAPKTLPPLTPEELAELPELPKGWVWTRLLEACEAVVDCHNKTAPYQDAGIPLVRTPSIRGMKLNFDEAIRYVSQETYDYWSRRCPPLPGDILFTREAPMGEAALIPEGKMICMGQRIMLLRPGKFLSGKYLLYATQSPIFKRVSDKMAVGTGVKHLRVGDVERLFFPLCSLIEQNEIANQQDVCISESDQLDQTITTSLQQTEALRQSILKKAFSGQLVPQDPNDEPASELLARIKAENQKKNGLGDVKSPKVKEVS